MVKAYMGSLIVSVVGSLLATAIVTALSTAWPWFRENRDVVMLASFGVVWLATWSYLSFRLELRREQRMREQIYEILEEVEKLRASRLHHR